jgi:hypothetical protein
MEAMGDYSHVRGIKTQLANDVELAVGLLTASDVWNSNFSEVFPEMGS